jgi:hypothetical protein
MPVGGGNYLLVVAGPYSRAQQVINIPFYKNNAVLLLNIITF